MKYQLFLWGLCGLFLLSETAETNFYGEDKSSGEHKSGEHKSGEISSDFSGEDLHLEVKFECPQIFGNYPDPEDCSRYFSCFAKVAVHKKCHKFTRFDAWRRTCLPIGIVICEKGKDKNTPPPAVTSSPGVTSAKDDFVCPSFRGSFPHPNDCSKYYSCVLYISTLKTCPKNQLFDAVKKECQPKKKVHCGDRRRPDEDETKTTETAFITTTSLGITEANDNFVCKSFRGNFPHPNDCSKYYKCTFFISSVKTCPKNELFDAAEKACKSEKEVDCGKRPRPGSTTTPIPTETTTESIVTVSVTETPQPSSTTETIPTVTETTAEISTATETITISTTQTAEEPLTDKTTDATSEDITTVITTTIQPTPPKHNCDEDDDDCIIEETGDPKNWFKCPRDVGAFPHPSSDKLFIFCMNWIPSAKKCGLDRIFSREKSTCVDAKYFL